MVTITGLGLDLPPGVSNHSWACGVGRPDSAPAEQFHGTANATVVRVGSATYLQCHLPPVNATDVLAEVSISANSQQYTETVVPFRYFHTPILIHTMSPATGPATMPTSVTFTGSNFIDSMEIACRFGFYKVSCTPACLPPRTEAVPPQ